LLQLYLFYFFSASFIGAAGLVGATVLPPVGFLGVMEGFTEGCTFEGVAGFTSGLSFEGGVDGFTSVGFPEGVVGFTVCFSFDGVEGFTDPFTG